MLSEYEFFAFQDSRLSILELGFGIFYHGVIFLQPVEYPFELASFRLEHLNLFLVNGDQHAPLLQLLDNLIFLLQLFLLETQFLPELKDLLIVINFTLFYLCASDGFLLFTGAVCIWAQFTPRIFCDRWLKLLYFHSFSWLNYRKL